MNRLTKLQKIIKERKSKMENFNQKNNYTASTNSLDKQTIYEDVKPADIPFGKYKKLEMENEVLKDVIIKLTVKVMALEKKQHPDVW